MSRWLAVLFIAPVLLLTACSAPSTAAPSHTYTLVLLKTGPQSGQLTPEQNQAAFAGHFANMEQLAEQRRLLVAGPYGTERHDPALRGLFVLDTASADEARAWAGTDPTTIAGVFVQEFHTLRTTAPLRAALESVLAFTETARREGRTLKPGDGARRYVLLTAENAAQARPELERLDRGVFLVAELDGTRCLALLDAKDVAHATRRFAPVLPRLGPHVLDDWFATDQLARLGELGQR